MATEEEVVQGSLEKTVEKTVEKDEEPFSLEILVIIKGAQAQHGLRHADYQRYRSYCGRRLRRIRRSLHFLLGHKNRFQHKKITVERLTDVRYLHLVLMSAELNWSYAMELRPESNTETRKRFHLLRKLRRAEQFAVQLEELCNTCPRTDARTKLEAQAYSAWMRGTRQFELQQWKESLDSFRLARTIYESLATALTDEDQRAIYTLRAEDMGPNVQYCAYQLAQERGETDINELMKLRQAAAVGGKQDMLTAQIDMALAQVREKEADKLQDVDWHGHAVPVRNETVRVFLVHVQDSSHELDRAKTYEARMQVYDDLLLDCQQAMQSLNDDIKQDASSKRTQKSEGYIAQQRQLLDYLTFVRLSKTVERNLLMAHHLANQLPDGDRLVSPEFATAWAKTSGSLKLPKPEDLVHLYNSVLQNVSDMLELPGMAEDEKLSTSLSAQRLNFHAFRCFYIAESYGIARKWREAVALYDKTTLYVKEACTHYEQCVQSTATKSDISALTRLSAVMQGRLCAAHASSILDTEQLSLKMQDLAVTDKPLLDRLNMLNTDPGLTSRQPRIIDFPPSFQPTPCKPLFFDLALNHMEYPDLSQRVEKQAQGFTGLFRGLFWGSKG